MKKIILLIALSTFTFGSCNYSYDKALQLMCQNNDIKMKELKLLKEQNKFLKMIVDAIKDLK